MHREHHLFNDSLPHLNYRVRSDLENRENREMSGKLKLIQKVSGKSGKLT